MLPKNEEERNGLLALVRKFSRCANYPRDPQSEAALVDGLQRAAVGMEHARTIVQRWSEVSPKCPTDFDLRETAHGLMGPVSWSQERTSCPLGVCDGSGFVTEYWLHTCEGRGGSRFVKRERITPEVFKAGKVGDGQKMYEGSRQCDCHAKPMDEAPVERPRKRRMEAVSEIASQQERAAGDRDA